MQRKSILKDAEDGNSFIPRLWARAHLDHLLDQGQSEAIRDQLSRFRKSSTSSRRTRRCWCWKPTPIGSGSASSAGSKCATARRFFAEGRANANYELLQQQMKRAGDWRIGLRRQILGNLSRLGRNTQAIQRQSQEFNRLIDAITASNRGTGAWASVSGTGQIAPFSSDLSLVISQTQEVYEFAMPGRIAGVPPIREPMAGSGFLNKSGEGGSHALGRRICTKAIPSSKPRTIGASTGDRWEIARNSASAAEVEARAAGRILVVLTSMHRAISTAILARPSRRHCRIAGMSTRNQNLAGHCNRHPKC